MKKPLIFLVSVVLLSWVLFCIPLVAPGTGEASRSGSDVFRLAGTFVPSLAGIVLTLRLKGRKGLRLFLLSAVKFTFRCRWFLVVFLYMPVTLGITALIMGLRGVELPALNFIDPPYGIVLAFFYILVLQGPLGEEFGWRGYALPGLLEHARPLWAGLIVGVFWSLWHLPLFFLSGSTQSMIPFAGYAAFTMVMSLVYTVVWLKTAGDMFYPLVLHTVSNLSHGVLTVIGTPEGQGVFFLVFLVVSAVFLAAFRRVLFERVSPAR